MLAFLARILDRFERKTVEIHVCAWCGTYEGADLETYDNRDWKVSHGICDACVKKYYPETAA